MILTTYIGEFIGICNYLKTVHCEKKGFYVIQKKELLKLLDKNQYDSSLNKLKIWKSLNWIDAEDDRVTKRIYERESKQYTACVKIKISVYEMMKILNEK